jgi:uncharacterized protein YukE
MDIMVDYTKLENAASSLDNEIKKLKELFEKQNNNFQLLEDNKMWYGTSCTNCINKYKELNVKYEEIITNLNNYKQFLINVKDTYKAFNEKANNSLDSIE